MTWTAANAKRHFSEVLEGALTEPQVVLLRGKPSGVMVSVQHYEASSKIQGRKTVADWLADLRTLAADEGDPELPRRSDRPDQLGGLE